ncbi:type II toxin-antitoxin system VapC family toxin [Haladaptatus sp. NG-WS-4]
MSYRYILDTEPLLAYYYGEPGGETVRDLLMDVYVGEEAVAVSEITATELMYKIARFETGSPSGTPTEETLATGRQAVRDLVDGGVTLCAPSESWPLAAEVKGAGGIALGDAYAVALAVAEDATLLVGADDDFTDLVVDVSVERIRTEPA